MLTFLNPLALWLGSVALIPVIIHFIGRSQTRKLEFPSIAFLKEKLVRSTQRQKIKNLLLLIVRTLLILFLLVALSNPQYQTKQPETTMDSASIFVIHNGYWGFLKLPRGDNILSWQYKLAHELDSLTEKPNLLLRLIENPEGEKFQPIYPRYGNYKRLVENIKQILTRNPGKYHKIFLPVFHWESISEANDPLLSLKQNFSQIQFVFMNFPAAEAPPAFSEVVVTPPQQEAVLQLQTEMTNSGALPPSARVISYRDNLPLQEIALSQGIQHQPLKFYFQLKGQSKILGKLQLVGAGDLPVQQSFSYQIPGPQKTLHAGSALTTLASLGQQTWNHTIQHVDKLTTDSLFSSIDNYETILLANTRIEGDRIYQKLIEFVRLGGRLIIVPGGNSNISKLNREFLVPAKLGYLASRPARLSVSSKKSNTKVTLNAAALKSDETFLEKYPVRGYINFQFTLNSSTKNSTLLSTVNGPLLVRSQLDKGEVFLWTVDLDDPQITSVGASLFTPVFHQSIAQHNLQGKWENIQTWSDSIFSLPGDCNPEDAVSLRDPEQKILPWQPSSSYPNPGPFAKLGHYTLLCGSDTTTFSVNLKPLAPDTLKNQIMENIKAGLHGSVILSPENAISSRGGNYFKLWKIFVGLALLMLLLELGITRFMALNRH